MNLEINKKRISKRKPSELAKIFAQRLKIEREGQGLSQEDLALKSGLNRNYIGMMERLERIATLNTLEKIAKALDTTVLELLTF